MKRILPLVFAMIVVMTALSACIEPTTQKKRYILSEALTDFSDFSFDNRELCEIELPVDTTLHDVLDCGLIVTSYLTEEMTDGALYGLLDKKGERISDNIYFYLLSSGNLAWGVRSNDNADGRVADVFDDNGELVLTLDVADGLAITAITDEYFSILDASGVMLYKIVDGRASRCLNAMTKLPTTAMVTAADDFILIYDTANRSYEIRDSEGWTPSPYGVDDALFLPSDDTESYKVAYLGDGLFFVLHTYNGDSSDYSYYVQSSGSYVKSECFTFNPKDSSRYYINYDEPIYDISNIYEPRLTYFQRKNFYINEGFTYLAHRDIDEEKKAVGVLYSIKDGYCNTVFQTKEYDLSKLRYVNGNAVLTSSVGTIGFTTNSTPFLIDGVGNTVWKADVSYTQFYYNDGVFSAYSRETKSYNAISIAGEIIGSYSALTPYVDGYAVAMADSKYYRLDKEGNMTLLEMTLSEYALSDYYLAVTTDDGKSAFTFKGECLVDGSYDELNGYRSNNYESMVFYAKNEGEPGKIFIYR